MISAKEAKRKSDLYNREMRTLMNKIEQAILDAARCGIYNTRVNIEIIIEPDSIFDILKELRCLGYEVEYINQELAWAEPARLLIRWS